MVNVNKLKGVIVEKGLTKKKMAKKMGISDRTFYNKMRRKVFNSDEIVEMASIPVSYTHLTLPTKLEWCRSRWSPYH